MTTIHLNDLYQDVLTQLRAAELRAAELRGQLQLVERLIAQSQSDAPIMSGDPIGASDAPT